MTPFREVFDKAGIAAPAHAVSAVPKLKSGVNTGLTVTVSDTVVAHSPAVGTNKYVPED